VFLRGCTWVRIQHTAYPGRPPRGPEPGPRARSSGTLARARAGISLSMVGAQQGCRLRWVLVLGTLWQSFFSTGIVYGWAGLLLLLKDGGVYVL
jgi:hypothetical protein